MFQQAKMKWEIVKSIRWELPLVAPMMPRSRPLPPHQCLRAPDFAFCFLLPFFLLPLEAPLPWALAPLCAAPFFCAS